MEAKEYFAGIYQDAVQPVMVLDERLEIQYCNAQFLDLCEAMGAKREALLQDQALRAISRCMKELRGDTLPLCLPYGELSVMLVPTHFEEQKYIALHPSRPAFSLKQEANLRILRNSHDRLLKYLNDIYSVVQKMEEDGPEREALAGGVRRILRMADHLYQVMDREGTMEYRVPMNMSAFAESYLAQFNQLSEKSVRFIHPDEALYARIMPEDMEIILGSLLSNAIRFGGEDIVLRLEVQGDALILSVWDSGEGPGEPERLFDWGWRTLDKKGGKGLGFSLPMAKMLAQHQGARLQYARRESGSSFEIVMKREQPPATTLAEWQAEPLENSLSRFRIELSDI